MPLESPAVRYHYLMRQMHAQPVESLTEYERLSALCNYVRDTAQLCNPNGPLDMDFVPTKERYAQERALREEKGYPLFEKYFNALDWTGTRDTYRVALNDTWDKTNARTWLFKALSQNPTASFVCQLLRVMAIDDLRVITQDATGGMKSVYTSIKTFQSGLNRSPFPFDAENSPRPLVDFLMHWNTHHAPTTHPAKYAEDFSAVYNALNPTGPKAATDVLARRQRTASHLALQNALFAELVGKSKQHWAAPQTLALPNLEAMHHEF